MSTRAIVAMPVQGGYETAWCWNDGCPASFGAELRRYFKTKDQVKELISFHSFHGVRGVREKNRLIKLFPNQISKEQFKKLSSNRFVHQHEHDGKVVEGGENGFFDTIEEMLEMDLNYVYVFENNKWKTYK